MGRAMNIRSGFLECIGNTPLIRLRAATDVTGCDIYGKAEFLNPGGSIKDRAALAIINDAEQRLIPAVPYSNPGNYARYSGRLAEELAAKEPNGAFWAKQFDNVANRDGHYRTTGPEIWEQTNGKVDGFTCAVGSGGTLGGVARALKERNPAVKIALSDPMGAALYNWFTRGELTTEGDSITEGIGQVRVTKNLEGTPIDMAYQITDDEALPVLFDLI